MTRHVIPQWLLRFARKQLVYALLASAIAAVFWAITGQAPSLIPTLVYTFICGNVMSFSLEAASACPRKWAGLPYVLVLAMAVPASVTLATAVIFFVAPPSPGTGSANVSFTTYLAGAWKFPVVASLVFGGGYFLYVQTRIRLEKRNRQLEQTLETKLAEREVEAEELRQARDIQIGLLPKDIPQLPEFEIAAAWEPARVVGGDYYDVIRLGPGKLAICIADVAGKGISSALLMANVQAAVRAFASATASSSRVCSQINSVLCTNIASGKFVTLFYGVLDARTRTLQFTNAGHPRPLLVRADGAAQHLENGGALLGVFPDWKYEDSAIEMQPGDMLLLFTDGITEAMAQDGEEFGEQRLFSVIAAAEQRSVNELQTQLLEKVKQFCDSKLNDDATLLMVAAPLAGAQDSLLSRKVIEQVLQHAGVS